MTTERIPKKNSGFSLVELVVTMSVLVIIFAILGQAAMAAFNSFAVLQSRQEIHTNQQSIRLAVLSVTRDARESDEILAHVGAELDLAENDLVMRAVSQGGVNILITYSLDDGQLSRIVTQESNGAFYPNWHIGFAPISLDGFIYYIDSDFRLHLALEAGGGEPVRTTVAIRRIPQ